MASVAVKVPRSWAWTDVHLKVVERANEPRGNEDSGAEDGRGAEEARRACDCGGYEGANPRGRITVPLLLAQGAERMKPNPNGDPGMSIDQERDIPLVRRLTILGWAFPQYC